MKYTANERTEAQNKTFVLKKQGYRAVRLVMYIENENAPVQTKVLAFGYTKDDTIPGEIKFVDKENYEFEFIYWN